MRGGPRSFHQGFSCPGVLWYPPSRFPFAYGAFTLSGRLSQSRSALFFGSVLRALTPPRSRGGLGSSGFARRYSRNRSFFLFLRLLRCFSSPGSPRMPIRGLPRLHHAVAGCFPAGFPHSDTHGSMDICSSPWLFAACRVFLRPLVPRHPPCALPA